uniref:LIM zinc-binding domain-containing protein n=2 Tax=Anopheles atroparvus TaxID=41427 RepID=A0AAG5CRV8_ANOAO
MAAAPSSNNNNTTNETDEFIKKSRVTRADPPKPAYDPLQFVQIKPAKLYDLNKAKPSTERKVVEVKTPREVVEDAEEWQCNLDNWKSSRRKRVEHIIDKITEAKKIEQEEVCRGRKKSKTFSEMLEHSGSRRRFILPDAEDDDDGGSFSDDLQEPRDSSKQQYKDESTDERATDDTSSCCSSKVADGESKTPDLGDSQEMPEMNEFSLAIENYKSKFPMTQHRTSMLASGTVSTTTVTTTTTTSAYVVSSIESNSNDNYESNDSNSTGEECKKEASPTVSASSEAVDREEKGRPVLFEFAGNRSETVNDGRSEKLDEPAKVNVIERRRLFEQFQQMSCASDAAPPASTPATKPSNNGSSQEERYSEGTQSSTDEPAGSSSEWFTAAGSIKERRAIFERYQSNEMMVSEEPTELGGGRSRSSSTVVTKSRSESNFGFVNGSTGRFELTLAQLKRNGGPDCCEDSGIQSTTDLSRSSVVSHADEHDPSLLLLSEDGLGKSPNRSAATLDSASEFSDTDCSNGQLLDNALDVAFEEMDSELHESCTAMDEQTPNEEEQLTRQDTEIVPLSAVPMPLPSDFEAVAAAAVAMEANVGNELVLLPLPKSTLTPPKEKPPPPPVDDEPELEQVTPSGLAVAGITSWMQKNEIAAMLQDNQNDHESLEANATDFYDQKRDPMMDGLRRNEYLELSSEQWRSLESYEVVQQVQHERQRKQNDQENKEEQQEREKDQQELLVYSNRIEAQPHHQLYDPGDHEEIVSVERELLQIEQEELQRRREKQMFYEKLTHADGGRLPADHVQHPHQQHLQPQQQQQHHQTQPLQQQSSAHQQPQQRPLQQQEPYYEAHHHHLHHHPHPHSHHHHHHRASMPAIDSRSLQNVNSYTSYDTPFVDDVHAYEMASLHRESMPNLSQAAASSSHPSSLSSYGEEAYSANSATSFDGSSGWPPVAEHRPALCPPLERRLPTVAPRPALNGFLLERPALTGGVGGGFQGGVGDRQRVSNSMFEQQPKDNKQSAYHPMMVNRGGQLGGVANTMPYGQHWLVQEAEQRRIEQHQKNASTTTKRPLPKFVIDAITQRMQKLNAGSPEQSDRSNLSEDSDLAMLHSMKHHHHQQHHHHSQQLPPPPPHHHQQQQPLPPLPPQQQQQQQQQYSNASDKVLSVSGKKECSHCRIELGKGAAMAIESLGLFYHIECFKCCVCHVKLGDGTNGIDVRVRKYRLHCQNCFSSEDGVKFSCV